MKVRSGIPIWAAARVRFPPACRRASCINSISYALMREAPTPMSSRSTKLDADGACELDARAPKSIVVRTRSGRCSSDNSSVPEMTIARSITLRSSRALPGQAYARRAARNSGARRGRGRSHRSQACSTKSSASASTSSRRSRKAGMCSVIAAIRRKDQRGTCPRLPWPRDSHSSPKRSARPPRRPCSIQSVAPVWFQEPAAEMPEPLD